MRKTHLIDNERGIALITVLLVALVVGVFSVAAALIGTNSGLINRYQERQNTLDAVADAGVELARSTLNANPALYPANGYTTLESGAAVTDASGAVIPNITRSLYAGPTGITSGQYGVFGSVVAVTTDGFGNTVVRRGEVVQQSFARYAYFTNNEGAIRFGAGDQLWGPVHSNTSIGIWNGPPNPSATFWDRVTVATGQTIINPGPATFVQGWGNVPPVPLPNLANLNALQVQAQLGNTSFNGSATGSPGAATTRIEFIAIDLNADGQVTGDNEGFMRVYQCLNLANNNCALWVAAKVPGGGIDDSDNCGHYHTNPPFPPAPPLFVSANVHGGEPSADSWSDALTSASRRCYLGGADELWGGFQAADAMGQWLQWPGGVPGAIAGRPDAQYLFPITRAFNPNFKGVVYVNGNVVVSGVVRSRVTLAATGNIVVADDVVYANPGAGNCNDILGLFAGGSIVLSDNTINTPTSIGGTYRTYDDTRDEFIQAIVLTLNIFTAENFASGPDANDPGGESCGAQAWGRGCLFLTGGVIQQTRGGVGTTGGTGYVKRYTYNQCGASAPPPYFPTTGYFDRGRYYEVNPVGFDVATLFALLTP